MQQHCPYSWLSVSCRSLNYPTSRLFKKWNKHILCFFDFSLVLFSHLILPINKHEALLLPHSYMQSLLFYCDIFLTTRFKINIHNHQNSSNVQQHRSYWLLKKTQKHWLVMKDTAFSVHRLEPESIFIHVDWFLSCSDTYLLLCEFLISFLFPFSQSKKDVHNK